MIIREGTVYMSPKDLFLAFVRDAIVGHEKKTREKE